jgi:hypothetical protein
MTARKKVTKTRVKKKSLAKKRSRKGGAVAGKSVRRYIGETEKNLRR